MAAKIRPGTQRHRAILAWSEASLSSSPDLHRHRSSRPRHPSGRCKHEPGAPIQSVYQPANRCLEERAMPAISNYRSALLAAAAERGFIHQCTDAAALDARLAEGKLTAYVGYDCTADSLHIGNLMSIMLLRLFQETGNRPIVLMGGGTTRIGDPSGKDEARRLLDDSEIARNMEGIRKVFGNFVRFGDGPGDAIMVNNADWLDELGDIPRLRES